MSTSGFVDPVPTTFMTFCIEPGQGISYSTYTYDFSPLANAPTEVPGGMGAVKADLLRELYATYYPSFQTNLNVITGTALQLVSWEISRETSGTYDVTSGTTRFLDASTPNPDFSNIILTANSMLAAITPAGGALLSNMYSLMSPTNQDLAFHSEVTVPEPATWGLVFLGLTAIGRRRVR